MRGMTWTAVALKEAVTALLKADELYPGGTNSSSNGFFLAMAYRKLGQPDNATADLTWAQTLVRGRPSSRSMYDNQGVWNDWLYARILLREAAPK